MIKKQFVKAKTLQGTYTWCVPESVIELIDNLNIQTGEGYGAVQQKVFEDDARNPKATGFGAVAFGGSRGDILTGELKAPTKASGIQAFATGVSTEAVGDFSFTANKDNKAYQKCTSAFGGANQAGFTKEEFEAHYWDNVNNVPLNGGKGKNEDGDVLDETGGTYEGSFSYAFVTGELNKGVGRASCTSGYDNHNKAKYSSMTGLSNSSTPEAVGSIIGGGGNQEVGVRCGIVAGENVRAKGGKNTIAVGKQVNVIAENTASFGEAHFVRHNHTLTAGKGLQTGADEQTIIGAYNGVNPKAQFQVGIGNSSAKKTGFEVLKDGRAKVLSKPKDNDDVVRLEDLKVKTHVLDFTWVEGDDGSFASYPTTITQQKAWELLSDLNNGCIVLLAPKDETYGAPIQFHHDGVSIPWLDTIDSNGNIWHIVYFGKYDPNTDTEYLDASYTIQKQPRLFRHNITLGYYISGEWRIHMTVYSTRSTAYDKDSVYQLCMVMKSDIISSSVTSCSGYAVGSNAGQIVEAQFIEVNGTMKLKYTIFNGTATLYKDIAASEIMEFVDDVVQIM